MREETRTDIIVSSILIALPALTLILGVIPGFIPMYDGELAAYAPCSLLSPPDSNVMVNLSPLLLILYAYTLILGICYFRSQALGTIKALFVFSVTCLGVSMLAYLPPKTVTVFPFVLIPITWGIMSIVTFIRMQLEIKRYDFD